MAGGFGIRRVSSDPVAVADRCPECGAGETYTSEFAASVVDDLPRLSAWCGRCGHGFAADALDDAGGDA